jgi:heme A synthase
MPASARFVRYAWTVVVVCVAVVLWGAYVRATGSGAGCGEHWPLCNGVAVPRSPSLETLIELTHRITSGLILLMVLGLGGWAFRVFPAGHRVRRAALASVVLILSEALIGAGLVLFGLVADDDSRARAVVLAVHLTNTFLLLGALALTAHWAGRPTRRGAWNGAEAVAGGVALAGCLLVGITGAIAALGDTLYPAGSLAPDAPAPLLLELRILHPWVALVVGLGLVVRAVALRGRLGSEAAPSATATAVALLVVVQLGAGLLNVVLLAPVWLQIVHLALADALWIALVLMTATALDAALVRAAVAQPASRGSEATSPTK